MSLEEQNNFDENLVEYIDEDVLDFEEDFIDSESEKIKKKEIKQRYYVNPKEFYKEITEYLKECEECEDKGLAIPQVPDNIGSKIIKIANKISYMPNFINYSYKNEMISDGIYYSIRYLRKFDYRKYDNPFAYFSTIIYRAFQKRIKIEKKNSEIKEKLNQHDDIIDNYNNYNNKNSKNL